MRRKLLVVPLTLVLVAALVAGSTLAAFTDRAESDEVTFAAGTVLIDAANVDDSKIIEDWEPGECRTVTYNVTNTGSKCLFLRARYEEEWYERDREFEKTGSAWGNIEGGIQYGQGQSQAAYFEYEKGSANATAPFTVELGEGANYDKVGTIAVWDDGDQLYVKFSSDDPTVMRKAHLYAGLEEPENTAPGRLGFRFEPHPSDCFSQHRFELPKIYEESPDTTGPVPSADYEFKDVDDNTAIYIAAHADVGTCKGTGEWLPWEPPDDVVSVEPCDDSWVVGNDGYLYYVGDDNDCLEGVLAGETVELCLEVCLDDEAGPGYQDRLLKLLVTFEAIQCSNDAAHNQGWQFTCTGEPPPLTPTGGYFTAKAQANAVFRTGIWRQQAEDLVVHTDRARLLLSIYGPASRLRGIELENIGQQDITLSQIIVSWTDAERPACGYAGTTSSSDGDQAFQEPTEGEDDGPPSQEPEPTADSGKTGDVAGNSIAEEPETGEIDSSMGSVGGNSTAEETEAPADDGTTEDVAGNLTADEPEGPADDGIIESLGGNSTAEDPGASADDGTTEDVAGNSTADEPGQPRIVEVVIPAGRSAVLWTGAEPSGTTLDIQDYILYPGERVRIDFIFDSKMERRTFTITFIMSDGSSLGVSLGPVETRSSAISDDGTFLDEEEALEPETTPDTENGDDAETVGDDSTTGDVGGNSTAEETEAPADNGTTEDVAGNSTAEESEAPADDGTADGVGGNSTAEEPGAGEDDSTIDKGDNPTPEEPEENEGDSTTTDNGESDPASQEPEAGEDDSSTDDGDADPACEEPEATEDDSTTDNSDNPTSEQPEPNEGDCTTDESKAGVHDSTAEVGDSDPPPADPGAGEDNS